MRTNDFSFEDHPGRPIERLAGETDDAKVPIGRRRRNSDLEFFIERAS